MGSRARRGSRARSSVAPASRRRSSSRSCAASPPSPRRAPDMYAMMVVLTIIYVIACSFLCFVVLIQKGEGGGLGGAFGGGAVDVAFGAKADMTWKRATAVCAAIFMILAMFLGVLHHRLDRRSIAE